MFCLLGCSAVAPPLEIVSRFPDANVTYLSYSEQHGVQIEYLAEDGGAHLWYPGNRRVVSGEWEVVLNEICYRYGANTYNPATLQRGGRWNCRFVGAEAGRNIAEIAGDPFALGNRRAVPYVLQRCTVPVEFDVARPSTCEQ